MESNAALLAAIKAELYMSAIAKFDRKFGLPCFIFYSRVFQVVAKVWAGCYEAAIDALGFCDLECSFLFRWFIFGGALDNDEIQDLLAFALAWCSSIPTPERGWVTLEEFFLFSS
jgi:hypothetical protein